MCSLTQNYLIRYSLLSCLSILMGFTLVVLGIDLDLLLNGPNYLARLVTNTVNRWNKKLVVEEDDLSEVMTAASEIPWVNIAILIIVAFSIILVFVILVGCVGACLISYSLLSGYIMAISIYLILLVAIAIWVFANCSEDSQLDKFFEDELSHNSEHGGRTSLFRLVMDNLQRDLQCCGLKSHTDWLEDGRLLPPSCCPSSCSASSWDCVPLTRVCKVEEAYTEGCLEVVRLQLLQPGTLIGTSGITLLSIFCLTILSLAFSLCLCVWARRSKRRDSKLNRFHDTTQSNYYWISPTRYLD